MKLKKKIFIAGVFLAISVLIIYFLYLFILTDVIVKPKYIYCANYNNEHYDYKHKVETSSIYSIQIDNLDFKPTKENLKYCNNLSEVIIFLHEVNNTNFLSELKGIKFLSVFFKTDDWSGISGCSNVETLHIYSSDFNNFELISGFSKLSELVVESYDKVKYSGFDTLSSLNNLVLGVENTDIKEISKAPEISQIDFHRLKETLNTDYFQK